MYFRIYYPISGYGKCNTLSQNTADAINEQAYFISFRIKDKTVLKASFGKGTTVESLCYSILLAQ